MKNILQNHTMLLPSIAMTLGVLLSTSCAQANHATTALPIQNPVFGITENMAGQKYERLSSTIRASCFAANTGEYWIFAQLRHGASTYLLVLGAEPGQESDSLGTAIELNDGKCTVEESKWLLSGFVPVSGYNQDNHFTGLPGLKAADICDRGALGDCHYIIRSADEELIVRGLVRDALFRSSTAWGNSAVLRRQICSSTINDSQPIVRQEINSFCKTTE